MKYTTAPGRGAFVQSVEEHAASWIPVLKERSRISDKACVEAMTKALTEAYEAGVRFGRNEEREHARDSLQSVVERALRNVTIEGGACPHCGGLGCTSCNDVGRFAACR